MLDVTMGSRQSQEGLTVFPLVARGCPPLPYALLADALAAGTVVIREVGGGQVPVLGAKNAGAADVLVLDGEQLVGARQNRMTNRSLLLPARSTTEVPVFCMEQGRWHDSAQTMQPTQQCSPSKVRRRAREVEARFAAAGAVADPGALSTAQSAVWGDIADTLSAVGAHSHTSALNMAFDSIADRLPKLIEAFGVVEDQVGFVACAGDEVLGLDLIGCRTLYARLHARLLRGYALDALERAAAWGIASVARDARPENAQRYLGSVRAATRTAAPTVGSGEYAVLTGDVIGGELTDGGHVVHLAAFPASPQRGGAPIHDAEAPPLAPPSRRRRYARDGRMPPDPPPAE